MLSDETENEELRPERVRTWYDTFVEDRCICQYCGFDGRRTAEDWVQLQGDHLIPRHIAGPNAEDKLNRVTACYYCNSMKRRFDPTHGTLTQVPNVEVRRQLIAVVRTHLEERKQQLWAYGGGLRESYAHMMRLLSP